MLGHDLLNHQEALVLLPIAMAISTVLLVGAGRLQRRLDDRWIARRKALRASRHSTPTLRPLVPLLVKVELDALPRDPRRRKSIVRSGPAVRRRPRGRARVHSFVEWALLVFVVVAFPFSVKYLGPGAGGLAYLGVAFTLLAITNRLDTWASARFWTPGNENAERRKRAGLRDSFDFLSARPPKYLSHARTAFIVLAVAGFLVGIVWPFIAGWTPGRRYNAAASFAIAFVFALVVLSMLERKQRNLEREWLAERKEERALRARG